MSPAEINILLSLHYSPAHPEGDAGFVMSTMNQLGAENLVIRTHPNPQGLEFKLTALGNAYVKCLLHMPIPTPDFIDASGKRISQYPSMGSICHIPETPKGGG